MEARAHLTAAEFRAMEARAHPTAAEFRAAAKPLLTSDPVTNTVLLTALAREPSDAFLLTLHDNGKLSGAVARTPPYPLIVSTMPTAAANFTAATVHDLHPEISGVTGPVEQVEAFLAAWTRITSSTATLVMPHRLFKLEVLKPPTVAGTPRPGEERDTPRLTDWFTKFMDESLPPSIQREPVSAMVESTLKPGAVSMFWEVDGSPVALAVARGPIEGMVRISYVYTPPEHRGRGYASAVTAAASQWAIDQRADDVLLFTDLTNETTNRIYPAIGYRPVGDWAEYRF